MKTLIIILIILFLIGYIYETIQDHKRYRKLLKIEKDIEPLREIAIEQRKKNEKHKKEGD